NIFRDPRWGRGHETFGEDPYLTSRLGVRFINGIQGHHEKYLKAAACAKHFAVHSGPEDERHSFNAIASAKDIRETYFPAFKACVKEAHVEAVMGAYNRTNGEPCCGSRTLLKDVLRDEWGFDGHVTSDCWAIKDFHEYHMVTDGPIESAALAMNNGCDLNCGNINGNLIQAQKDGLISEETIEQSVTRLFETRMKLGLFDSGSDNPYSDIKYDVVDCDEHRVLNLKAAEKCITLLKNENQMLPLKKDSIKKIGIIGPNADNRRALVGNYEGTASEYVTILEGIREYLGDSVRIQYSEGCSICRDRISGLAQANDRTAEARAVAAASDVVIACFGLDPSLEGEEGDQGNEFASGDKPNLNLPGIQKDVLQAIYESGKPVVLVLLSGSAIAVPWADEHIPAIIQGWYPGAQGGRAIARVLFGDVNPEGKLPITFYRTTEELPDFRDYSMEGRTYRYMKNEALYPFGYGLSYTDYEISDVEADTNELGIENKVTISASISNTGAMDGAQTIQVYVKFLADGAPNFQLKALKKVWLRSGETKHVDFTLDADSFGLYVDDGVKVLSKGNYEVYVGMSQPDDRSIRLTGKKPICIEMHYDGDDMIVPE
ncbi:MAG: glycoside hydrolase family 3 protein, partial [Lachnospiraceae bacterium]|nr:glycoside hydrolase family 3 protein [Lachnospiraceae bacterium]